MYKRQVLRKLIKVNEQIANDCYSEKEKLEDILESAEKRIFDIVQKRNSGDFVPIKDVVLRALDRIEAASRNKGSVTGIPTGFIDLDYKTTGMQPSDLVLIAARPSMGKTAFVLNICLLYTSDAADEEDSVDLGGRRIIKKKQKNKKKNKHLK